MTRQHLVRHPVVGRPGRPHQGHAGQQEGGRRRPAGRHEGERPPPPAVRRRQRCGAGLNAGPQGVGRPVVQRGGRDRLPQGPQPLVLVGARRAFRQVVLDLEVPDQVQLAVGVGVQQVRTSRQSTSVLPRARAPAAWSCLRARDSRDMTVPTGTPATATICW